MSAAYSGRFTPDMKVEDAFALCHLRCMPEQRLVHQHGCQPGPDGHIVCPETVFFRMQSPKQGAKLNKTIFRRLNAAGWLERVGSDGGGWSGVQDEYQLSAAAMLRFERDFRWRRGEDVYRDLFGLRPAAASLTVIEGGRA